MTQAEMQMVNRIVEVLNILCKEDEDAVRVYLTYILIGE